MLSPWLPSGCVTQRRKPAVHTGSERVSGSRGNRRDVTAPVRRAAGFALVGSVTLAVPWATVGRSAAMATIIATAPFLLLAALSLTVFDEGTIFELFARPGDRRDGRLYGLAGFALAIAGLAIVSVQFGLPIWVFVGSVFVLSYGNLAGKIVGLYTPEEVVATAGFVGGGFLAGVAAQVVAAFAWDIAVTEQSLALMAFLAATGALTAALLRTVLFERDDPLVLVTVGLLLWLLADLQLAITVEGVVIALVVTTALGYVSYAIETASLPGMLTGVLLALLTIVLGSWRWFILLIAFYGVGGLSTKFHAETKIERGIADVNEDARGSGNVLANSLVALVAVLAQAASPAYTGVDGTLFLFAFAGAVAAAMSDTLSSEIGGVFDDPVLVTTFERVEPGTDGAITWQGEVAGVVGAALIAAIAGLAFTVIGVTGAGLVLAGGVLGMTVDSLLGATIEGRYVANEGVNLLATLAAAVGCGAGALALGLV